MDVVILIGMIDHYIRFVVSLEDFLKFALSRGNDLITPAPQFNFPGLVAGDRWCVCAQTWQMHSKRDMPVL